jgi:hypothetical protein
VAGSWATCPLRNSSPTPRTPSENGPTGAAVYALPTARTIRPPDRAAAAGHDPGRLTVESSASAGRVAFAVLDRRRRER